MRAKEFKRIVTVGIGDSLNDLPLLNVVDHPIFLKGKQEPSWEIASKMRNLILREGTGPVP